MHQHKEVLSEISKNFHSHQKKNSTFLNETTYQIQKVGKA